MGDLTQERVDFMRKKAQHNGGRFIGRTWMIALWFNLDTAKARRFMLTLARAGTVQRSERYSAVNDVAWEFTE